MNETEDALCTMLIALIKKRDAEIEVLDAKVKEIERKIKLLEWQLGDKDETISV